MPFHLRETKLIGNKESRAAFTAENIKSCQALSSTKNAIKNRECVGCQLGSWVIKTIVQIKVLKNFNSYKNPSYWDIRANIKKLSFVLFDFVKTCLLKLPVRV